MVDHGQLIARVRAHSNRWRSCEGFWYVLSGMDDGFGDRIDGMGY